MTPLYPLRFRPIFREYLWGGRRLGTVLGKSIGGREHVAESWEVVDHGEDQSVVSAGPLQGQTLGQLMRTRSRSLLGREVSQFPLLLKFLDAARNLSVQVHPNDQQAATLEPPDLGKTEAWVVLAAGPESRIYAGLREGVTRDAFAKALEQGDVVPCLFDWAPQVGDCIFIPAGTVHALGAGLLIAEIQQASDTTFRLFDWNRVDKDGRSRPLHIEQGLGVIDFHRGPVERQTPERLADHVECLVSCDQFRLLRRTVTGTWSLSGSTQCHLLMVLEGEIQVEGDPAGSLPAGQTVLLPAECIPSTIKGHGVVLDISVP